MIKTKICGITREEDAILAAQLGATAIGFIFYPKSKRYITPQAAAEISKKVKKYGLKTIGVFVNSTPESINEIAEIALLDYVQLHGTESADECIKLKQPFIKNIRNIDELKNFPSAFAFLIDAPDTENWGGTGQLSDWKLAKEIKAHNKILILSGGLSSENIQTAISTVSPDFIDVSSSLELSAGKKDKDKMNEFFNKLKTIF